MDKRGECAGLSGNNETESEAKESEPFQSSGSEYQPSSLGFSSVKETVEPLEENETMKAGSRKRKRNVKSWKRSVQKVQRARGESYKSMSTGQMVLERKQGTDCKCEKECLKKVSPDEKNEIFTAFNALADQEKQDSYLSSLITVNTIKRRRKNVVNSQRNCSYKYRVSYLKY